MLRCGCTQQQLHLQQLTVGNSHPQAALNLQTNLLPRPATFVDKIRGHGRDAVVEETVLTEIAKIILSPRGLTGKRPMNLPLKLISPNFFLGNQDFLSQGDRKTLKYLLNQVRQTCLWTRLTTSNEQSPPCTIGRQVTIRIQIGVSYRVTVRQEVRLFLFQLRLAGIFKLIFQNLSTLNNSGT